MSFCDSLAHSPLSTTTYCQDKKLFYGQIDPNILVEVLDKIDRWKTTRSQKEDKVDSSAHERISFVDVGSGTGAALMAAGRKIPAYLLMQKFVKMTNHGRTRLIIKLNIFLITYLYI